MNKIMVAIVAAIGLVYSAIAGGDYGFVIDVPVSRSHTWTNDNAYPFVLHDMRFNSSVANTATVAVVREYKVNQVRGNVVTTNDWDVVETNYYYTVTNVVSSAFTNTILSVTNSGSTVYTVDDITQMYIQYGDKIIWTFSDTATNVLTWTTIR
jgi:hypothetical protein